MYKSPDIIKVDINVKDIFAAYLVTGCPMDEFLQWNYTSPCEGTPDYRQIANTYVGLGMGHQCYSVHNA